MRGLTQERRAGSLMRLDVVADTLGVTPEAIKKHVRDLYPGYLKPGLLTWLDEGMVTEIKRRMVPTTAVVGATTSLEIEEMTLKVIAYHKAQADRLRAELALAAPKIEAAEALMVSERCMSVTDAAKFFALHPRAQVFPYLRARGYLTAHDLPTQAAIDAGYLALRETRCPDGEIRKQTVVLVSQLDTWRLRVVPQIYAWIKETA